MTILAAALLLLPFVLSPGASFALTVSGAATGDRAAGLRVGLGTALGITLIAAVAGTSGVGVVVASNTLIRAWFEIVGGLLLIAFGAAPLVKTWRARSPAASQRSEPRPVRLVAWGFVAVITNAKALALYVIVVPSTMSAEASPFAGYATIAAVHIALLFVWLALIAVLITRVPAIAHSHRIMMGLQLAASGVLIGLGVHSGISGLVALA
jgi:threonine/homoserine/homoserine lactone efflux protein